MINVSVEITNKSFTIVCKGHANYADVGQDIVCSAVSSVVQYIVYTLAYKYDTDFEIKDGFLAFCLPKYKKADRVWLISFIECLNSIKNQYPDNIDLDIQDETSDY